MQQDPSSLDQLEQRLGANWSNLREAKRLALEKQAQLREALVEFQSEDASIVVFGSLSREEFTEHSDLDWTLLIDGAADPQHVPLARKIKAAIKPIQGKEPGREGTFGTMAFSHELVHQIGGQNDTNKNTTLRLLLLLESCCVSRDEAYRRVIRNVLIRYLFEDRGLWSQSKHRVPRFLQNDFARYWRTIAVDFAFKQRDRGGEGWAIRNMKLRISRKLIYVSGLLGCFRCHLDFTPANWAALSTSKDREQLLVDYLGKVFEATPLEILSEMLLRFPHLAPASRVILDAYDGFVGVLADGDKRERLEQLTEDEANSDEVYQTTRRLSHAFRDGLLGLFFDQESGLDDLTKNYGVF